MTAIGRPRSVIVCLLMAREVVGMVNSVRQSDATIMTLNSNAQVDRVLVDTNVCEYLLI